MHHAPSRAERIGNVVCLVALVGTLAVVLAAYVGWLG